MSTKHSGANGRDYPLQYLLDLNSTPDALITPEHAGALTGLEPDTLRKMSKGGKFCRVHTIGHRTKRYRYGDVIAWLRQVAAADQAAAAAPGASAPPGGAAPAKHQ
jgi:hypothetical protein